MLKRLKELEVGTESEEFEAGVLALAGLREEAIRSYRRGLAVNPGRIESYLLMATLMKELGQTKRAVGMVPVPRGDRREGRPLHDRDRRTG